MTHFVSASCEGNLCSVCKAPATHKLGEEIAHDEPCPTCGKSWRWRAISSSPSDHPNRCSDFYHHCEDGVPRHNLTAYVCCAHFTMIVGTAAGCPPEKVMHAGIERGAAALEREVYDLRGALVWLADDWSAQRERRAAVRAIRTAANQRSVPFILNNIDGATATRLADLVAFCEDAREKLGHWPTDWQYVKGDPDDDSDTAQLKWTATSRGEETEVDTDTIDYVFELGEFIAWLVNTMPKMIETIERIG